MIWNKLRTYNPSRTTNNDATLLNLTILTWRYVLCTQIALHPAVFVYECCFAYIPQFEFCTWPASLVYIEIFHQEEKLNYDIQKVNNKSPQCRRMKVCVDHKYWSIESWYSNTMSNYIVDWYLMMFKIRQLIKPFKSCLRIPALLQNIVELATQSCMINTPDPKKGCIVSCLRA